MPLHMKPSIGRLSRGKPIHKRNRRGAIPAGFDKKVQDPCLQRDGDLNITNETMPSGCDVTEMYRDRAVSTRLANTAQLAHAFAVSHAHQNGFINYQRNDTERFPLAWRIQPSLRTHLLWAMPTRFP